MSVDLRYYHDWIAPVNGHRYRLVITPHGYDQLALGTQPAFGAGASGDYYPIPQGVIPTGEIKPSASFDDLPLGLMDSPGMSLTLDYGPMTQLITEGETELSDLWGVLQDPEFIPTGTLAVNPNTYTGPDPWIVTSTITGTKIRTGNYVELLTDGGNSALGVGSFKVVGAWVQHIVDEPEETYNPKTGSDTLKIEMTGAFRYAAEIITPEMINLGTQTIGDVNSEIVLELVDVRYVDDFTVERLLGDADFGPGFARRRFIMYRLRDMLDAVAVLVERVYTRLLRADATFICSGGLGNLMMFDWVDLREQTENRDGAASSTSVTEPYIVGFVDFDDDEGVFVDGWLHNTNDAGKDRLYGYGSAYELLKSLCEGTGVAGTLRFSTNLRDTPSLSMIGFLENPDALALPIDEDSFKGDAYVMQRARRVITARAELVGAISGDVTEQTYKSRAVANDAPRLIPVVFNCLPQCGERNDVNQIGYDVPTLTFTIRSALGAFNTLFYKDGSEFKRCHHYVGVAPSYSGGAVFEYYTLNAEELPYPSGLDAAVDVWHPLRLWMLTVQRTGGLSYAVTKLVVTKFGHQQQTLYPTAVSIEKALPEYMGSHGTFADGSELTGQARHATYPGAPILVKTELDISAGTSAVELLALGGIS